MHRGYTERTEKKQYQVMPNGEEIKITTVRFSREEWERLEDRAKESGISRGEYIRNAIAAYEANYEPNKPEVIISYLEQELTRIKSIQTQSI